MSDETLKVMTEILMDFQKREVNKGYEIALETMFMALLPELETKHDRDILKETFKRLKENCKNA